MFAVPDGPPLANNVPVTEPTRISVEEYPGAFHVIATTFVPARSGSGLAVMVAWPPAVGCNVTLASVPPVGGSIR